MTLRPDWLALVNPSQRTTLVHLLASSQRSRRERVDTMLASPPLPSNKPDAQARVAAVIAILTSGYRVGDRHPASEIE